MFEAHTVMTKNVVTVQKDTPVIEAVRLLVKHQVSGLPVVDEDNNLVGMFSEKDALELLQSSESPLEVKDYMTKDVISFDVKDSLIDICRCLIKHHFRRVPITREGKKLAGVVSRHDIMKKILEMKHVVLEDVGLEGEDA